jgi:glutathione S-transferase
MRLHHHPNSTFSRRVRIACHEKGLPLDLVQLDFAGGEHRSARYRQLNPYGRVPTLEDEGFVLFESTAILEYLEAKHPDPPLVPADPKGRALVAMHAKLCDLEWGIHTRALIFPARFVSREKWNHEEMAKAREGVQAHLEMLDAQLGNREWLVADRFTLAEVAYAPFVQFFDVLELRPSPRLRAWAERILARPSARATTPTR